jgi:RNA polymerase sigma-70 factor (ECF subfamily)
MKVLEMSEDGALLDGLRRGDESAYEAIFARHWSAVYAVLYRLVGTREEAEDLAQEVFLKLHQRPLPPEREHNLPGWLYRVATNLGYNALRASRRRQARQERVAEPESSTEGPPLEAALAAEEREAVRQVLATMPPRQQACLVLRHQGLSYAEVAAALGVASSSVGTLLARAEAEFRRRYVAQRGGL